MKLVTNPTNDEAFLPINDSTEYFLNQVYNYSVIDFAKPCNVGLPESYSQIFVPIVYFLVVLIGAIGNGMVLLVLTKRGRRQRKVMAADYYVLHLSLVDLLLVLSLPFWAVYSIYEEWLFGRLMCKAAGYFYAVHIYASVLLLASLSLHRYQSIALAAQGKQGRPQGTNLHLVISWISALILALPEAVFRDTMSAKSQTLCELAFPTNSAETWRRVTRTELAILGFLGPLLAMVLAYGGLAQGAASSRISLCFSWWPSSSVGHLIQVTLLIDTWLLRTSNATTCGQEEKVEVAMAITEVLGFVHCCLNPLLYGFVRPEFRKRFVKLMKNICSGRSQRVQQMKTTKMIPTHPSHSTSSTYSCSSRDAE
uniref:Chemokine (C-X-C motif) receptor 3, tandem duplicate 2 n=1 Tax=Eptatretus burgeri TaxID=7764 RepID=A0A8C4Q0A4_EPTBU